MPQIEGPTRTIPPVMLWLTVLLIVARAGVYFYEKKNPPLPTEQIAWNKPEEVDLKPLAATQKPLLYWFTAAWCGPCKMLEEVAFSNKDVIHLINEKYIPIRVVDRKIEDKKNSKTVQMLENKYAVFGFPKLEVVLPEGRLVDSESGFLTVNATALFLKQSLIKADFAKGISALRLGKPEDAIAPFTNWLKTDSGRFEDRVYTRLYLSYAYIRLNQKAKAKEVVENGLSTLKENSNEWPFCLLHYLDYSKGKLNDCAENDDDRLTETHFFWAVRCLYEGQQKDALEALHEVYDSGNKSYDQYVFAVKELDRLE